MPTPQTPPPLESVLQQLHDSEINAGIQTFYDTGIRVWIGDEANGVRTETTIDRTASFVAPRKWPVGVTAASWLHEATQLLIAASIGLDHAQWLRRSREHSAQNRV
jgi:hypothetical protein